MCSTHDVICFKCGKKLAWWSMYDNLQKEDEYECSAAITEGTNKIIMDEVIQDKAHLDELTRRLKELGYTHREWTYCKIGNETAFCKKCAQRLKYKCPVCGGKILLNRKR